MTFSRHNITVGKAELARIVYSYAAECLPTHKISHISINDSIYVSGGIPLRWLISIDVLEIPNLGILVILRRDTPANPTSNEVKAKFELNDPQCFDKLAAIFDKLGPGLYQTAESIPTDILDHTIRFMSANPTLDQARNKDEFYQLWEEAGKPDFPVYNTKFRSECIVDRAVEILATRNLYRPVVHILSSGGDIVEEIRSPPRFSE